MAKVDLESVAERLFVDFLAPLVLGGALRPGKPVGGKTALSLGDGRSPGDVDLLSRCELARVRVARKIAPVDMFQPAPTGAEWALGAVLHDLVQSTHPGFHTALRRRGPKRILDVAAKTLARVPPPTSLGEALSRHTWFSRMFALTRIDVELRWWTGAERFLGAEPPARLQLWPELRRVRQTRTPRELMDLPTSGAVVDQLAFAAVIGAFLTKTPLTDLATMDRASPTFAWTHESLALVATQGGRTVANRALRLLPHASVDAALGRATRRLFADKAVRALLVASDLLRDRALMAAAARVASGEPEPISPGSEESDASFAIGAGALAASHFIAQTGGGFNEADRRAILAVLAPAAGSAAAKEVRALLA